MQARFGVKRIISPLFLIFSWELTARGGLVDPFFLPAPTAIAESLYNLAASGELLRHTGISLFRALSGYILAAIVGLSLGILMGWSKRIEELIDPLVELIRPVSTLALIPLMIIWFGVGNGSKIIVIFKACFFPILLNTVAGIKNVDLRLIQAARSLGAKGMQIWAKVIIPAALPTIFTGLRISTAISMLAIVGVEMFSGDSGLGFLVIDAQRVFATEKMFAGIITLSVLGFGMDCLTRMVERRFVAWHGGAGMLGGKI